LRKVTQGISDGAENQLDPTGWRQAKRAAQSLFDELAERYGPQDLRAMAADRSMAVITSPLGRARDTAHCFTDYLQKQTGVELLPEASVLFTEMSFGEADGRSLDEMRSMGRPDLVSCTERYRRQDATIRFPAGESFLDALHRAPAAIAFINRRFKTDSLKLLAVYSHGRFTSALRAAVGDLSIVAPSGKVEFRSRALDHATPHWLPVGGPSRSSASGSGLA
jgi:broad specificity phosphatase PhoE